MLKIIKVTGESLSPDIQEGDYVLIGTCSFLFPIKKGDTVVFVHPHYGRMIKKVTGIQKKPQTITVSGTHPQSVDSRDFGNISRALITGKVLLHISPS